MNYLPQVNDFPCSEFSNFSKITALAFLLSPVANLPPVTPRSVQIWRKLRLPGVIDTRGKFSTSVNYPCGQYALSVCLALLVHLELQIPSRIRKKIGAKGIIRSLGEDDL